MSRCGALRLRTIIRSTGRGLGASLRTSGRGSSVFTLFDGILLVVPTDKG